jgi:hypothetical protein
MRWENQTASDVRTTKPGFFKMAVDRALPVCCMGSAHMTWR